MRLLHLVPAFVLAAALAPLQAADTYAVDPVHTAALFTIKHLGTSNTHGRFNDVAGTLVIDAADPAASKVEITIQAGSVDTFNAKRDGHLASPDFFDSKQFTTLGFVSTSFKAVDATTYEVAGNFTLHGVTKPLTITARKVGEGKDPWGGVRIGFDSTFTIKRSDFGMTKMLDAVGDDIEVTFSTEAVKK